MRGHRSCSRYKMRRYKSGPCNPYRMPKHRLCKMPRHGMPRHRLRKMTRKRSDPCEGTDTSSTCEMREQRCGKVPEQRFGNAPERGSGGSKMHGNRPGPQQMPEPQTGPCKMPSRRRWRKASVCSTIRRKREHRPSSPRKRGSSTPRLLDLATNVSGILGRPVKPGDDSWREVPCPGCCAARSGALLSRGPSV